jgi:hypothetical protein
LLIRNNGFPPKGLCQKSKQKEKPMNRNLLVKAGFVLVTGLAGTGFLACSSSSTSSTSSTPQMTEEQKKAQEGREAL